MIKFRNEHLYHNFNVLCKKIEFILSTKKYNFPQHSNKVINQRLIQKICYECIKSYGIVANNRIKKGLHPFEKYESKLRLGELFIDFKNNKLKLSLTLILNFFFKFFYEYLKVNINLIRVIFQSKIKTESLNILLDSELLNTTSEKLAVESLETIKKSKIDILKKNLLININDTNLSFTKSSLIFDKNPFFFLLRSTEFKSHQHFLLLLKVLIIPLKLFPKLIINPHLILISQDFPLFPVINFLNNNHKINSIIFTTSHINYQPLWSRDFTNKNFTTHFLNYSNNSNDFVYEKNSLNLIHYPLLSYISTDVNWVWSKNQIKKYQSFGLTSLFKIVDPIILGLPKKSNKVIKPNNHFSIIIFDVPTFKEDFIKKQGALSYYYSSKNMIKFLNDIISICKDLKGSLGVNIVINLKNKRKKHKLYDEEHTNKILKLSSDNNCFNLIPYDSNIYSLLNNSSCSISIPYTSTASISDSLGIPSIYYDPTNSLIKPYYFEPNIYYTFNKKALKNHLKKLIISEFKL